MFYVRGGFYNNDGLITADPNPAVRAHFAGNDDHPSYSDAQISEASIAELGERDRRQPVLERERHHHRL